MKKLLAPYFSREGRSSRLEWWIIEILVVFGFRLNELVFEAMATGGGRFDLGAEAGQTWMMAAATLLWLNIASNVRRLHDRGKSGWWSVIYLIPGIGQLWCFIECGFMKGQPHANRYGPPVGDVGVYQSLADRMTARLQALGAGMAAPTSSHTPKAAASSTPIRATPAATPSEPAAAASSTRRVSVLAASQRPTVQRGGSGLLLPSGRTLRMAIAVAALLVGLGAMVLTGGIPIPTGFAPVGDNSYTGVFRSGSPSAQP
jgi:uncharacterized membrane protein YhaH (DUF805 family)